MPRSVTSRHTAAAILTGLLVVAGFMLVVHGLLGAARGSRPAVTLGMLAALVVLGVGVPLLLPSLFRALDGHGRLTTTGTGVAAMWVTALASQLSLTRPLLRIPSAYALAVGVALLALGGIALRHTADTIRPPEDPLRRPITDAGHQRHQPPDS